jgi:hypothetical protein
VAIVVALLLLLVRGLSRARLRDAGALLIVLPAGLLAYAIVISLGRPLRDVLDVTYYLYGFAVLLVPFVYALVDPGALSRATRAAAAAVLAAFVVVHGVGTHQVAREIRKTNADASSFLGRVSAFIDAHKREPDFTFAIRTHRPTVDPEIPLKEGYPDDPAGPTQIKHLSEILFARYYRRDQPKYVFDQGYSLMDTHGLVRPSRVTNTPASTATAPMAFDAGIGSANQTAATVIATMGTRFE